MQQQQHEDLAPHVKEISRALGGKLSDDQVSAELTKYIEYGVPLAQAKRDIVRNYGGSPGRKKVAEIAIGDSSVEVVCKIVTVNPKEITVKEEKKSIFYGLLGDDTGTIPYTAWKDFKLAKGQTLRIKNAYVSEWREAPQLNLGDRSAIEPATESISLPPLPSRVSAGKKIAELRGGLSNVAIVARVTKLETKEIVRAADAPAGAPEKRTIFTGELADETGKVRFTAWHDHALKLDGVYRFAGAYVRAWKGLPDLNLGEATTIEALSAETLPPASELAARTISIGELSRIGGGTDVHVEGTLVEIKEGSGLILRCPECTRVVQKRECRTHGKVDGIPDLRVKAVLDDGTGALTCFIGREVTEKLIGMDLERCQAIAKEAMSQEVVQEEVEAKVSMRPMRVRGNATSDDFGLMLIATHAELSRPPNLVAEAERLLELLSQEVS